jgi:hypothetical protein
MSTITYSYDYDQTGSAASGISQVIKEVTSTPQTVLSSIGNGLTAGAIAGAVAGVGPGFAAEVFICPE